MKILYASRSKLSHSVNAVYLKGLRANNINVEELFIQHKEYPDFIKYLFRHRNSFDIILIGYDSPFLACLAKLFSNKKVVYNALCSVYERLIISRALAPKYSIKAAYYWLSDLLAVHSADLTMVETDGQAEYFRKIFFLPKNKIFKAWTGVDDDRFCGNDRNIERFQSFTAVFRGQFLPEAGVDILIESAKLLSGKDIRILLIGGGLETPKVRRLIGELKPDNLEFINSFLPDNELRLLMERSHLSLGQLANHPRLERTIPHKAYEALAMRLPYLTAANKGILELLENGETCITCEPASAESLAEKILWAKNNPDKLDKIAENGFRLYNQNLRPEILAKNLLNRLV